LCIFVELMPGGLGRIDALDEDVFLSMHNENEEPAE
jgi:hypothetical protein